MKGVHCHTSAMITESKAFWPSQSTPLKPNSLSHRLMVPTVGWYMYRHIRPTTTGAIIIGKMNSVRRTDMPRRFRSSNNASPTPRIISMVTTQNANLSVTHKLSRNAGSP